MSEAEDKLRIPSAAKMQQLTELISEDDDFRFPRIKMNRDKPRYELPDPTPEDRDNITSVKAFKAVVLISKKNFYQDEEAKARNEDPKEKRVLYILRPGKVTPEILYVNPTSVKPWRIFAMEVVKSGGLFHTVLCEFAGERINSKKTGFSWNKMTFRKDRTLDKDELEHVNALRPLIEAKVQTFVEDSELDKFEDEASGIPRHEEDAVEKASTAARAVIEEDEPAAKKPGSGSKKPEPKPETPEAEKKSEAPKAGYPSLDDAEENLERVADPEESGGDPPAPKINRPSLDEED